jgi:hypothetical protein
MKKLALTNLILLVAIKSVSACMYDADKPSVNSIAEMNLYSTIYFLSIVFLILANISLFFFRKQKDYLVLISVIAITSMMILSTLFGVLVEECSFLRNTLKWEFIIFLAIFCFHIGLWLSKSSLRINKGDMTFIKLR